MIRFATGRGRGLFALTLRAASVVFAMSGSLAASAYTGDDFAAAVENLGAQADMLARQSSATCEKDYRDLYSGNTIKISLFYGYEDFDKVTADAVHAKSMAYALMQNCRGTMGACGFKRVSNESNITRLKKEIAGKTVLVNIYSTSLTDSNYMNMDPNGFFFDQDKLSREIKADFYREMHDSDVLFYSGHSRYGSGFGFDPQSMAQHAWNYLFKQPLHESMQQLSSGSSRLKMLGVLSCTSDKFYRAPIEAANPRVSLALTKIDLEADNGEQISLGLLNSLLTKKCGRELLRSVRSVNAPDEDAVTIIKKR
jgi:hypothetical protein